MPGRLVAAVLRCYPARWRSRHGDEAAELAELLIRDGTPARAVALSYLGGAARARLTGRPSRRVASNSTASQQECQSTPRWRATAETVVSSNVNASVAHRAALLVSFARGGTSSCCSVNTP